MSLGLILLILLAMHITVGLALLILGLPRSWWRRMRQECAVMEAAGRCLLVVFGWPDFIWYLIRHRGDDQ